ncbi:MAG: NADH-quinone oxidoreductase subunit A [SAR202 cluster bacterium]|nr:NADH-quinone oxidoreductase subunit A [SAR202 cluster bacterium]
MLENYFRQYGLAAIFLLVAFLVPVGMLAGSWVFSRLGVRPAKPSPVKDAPYECGMEPIGGPWNRFNFRYYAYALLFVIFGVEVVFLYPWAVRFIQMELFALIEMAIFILVLAAAWAYAWRKGDLEWR